MKRNTVKTFVWLLALAISVTGSIAQPQNLEAAPICYYTQYQIEADNSVQNTTTAEAIDCSGNSGIWNQLIQNTYGQVAQDGFCYQIVAGMAAFRYPSNSATCSLLANNSQATASAPAKCWR